MRALLSTIGSRGDVQPLVALALQLRTLGHDARLCVPPDFREWIESFGFSVTPTGPAVRTAAAPDRGHSAMEAFVASQFDSIDAAARDCDVILAATALQVAARSVAESRGIPYVFAAYCPIVFPSPHHAPPVLPPVPGETPLPASAGNAERWARNGARFNDLFRPVLNSHRASIGLPAVDDLRGYMFTERPWLAADATLAPWPDASDDAVFQTGAWLVGDDRPLPRELATFLDAGEPPVFFGFGSARVAQDVTTAMIRAARVLGRRAIVSRGWAELSVGDDGADCVTVGEVNLQTLFTRVAAVVHHGGSGTTTIAARAGAPQVVVPQVYDQHYFAQRIQDLGIGTAHAPGMPTPDSLTTALEYTLQPEVAARARTIATQIRIDGARIAAERLVRAVPRQPDFRDSA